VLDDVLGSLACPHCGSGFGLEDRSLRCANGHVFDIARQGYVNLMAGDARPGTADTAEMVDARASFLAAGHFAPVAEAVAKAVAEALDPETVPGGPPCVVEPGAGTGYYLASVLERVPGSVGLALDISKAAARRAARAHPRMAAAVADTWRRLPVGDKAAAAVLDVFAPRNAGEFARILRSGGLLVVVTPTPDHLRELVVSLGLLAVDEEKDSRLSGSLEGLFEPVSASAVEREMSLQRGEVAELVAMGPSAWHSDADEMEAAVRAMPQPLSVTLSVSVRLYLARAIQAG
jgi:23S rRNA (guanine745-N1)-methyltransferase